MFRLNLVELGQQPDTEFLTAVSRKMEPSEDHLESIDLLFSQNDIGERRTWQ